MSVDPPKVFVSHAGEDKTEYAEPLARKLREFGADAWLDKWEIAPGDSLVQKIFYEAMSQTDAVVVILSKTSVVKPWVAKELDVAVVRNIQKLSRVIPVRIDDCEVPEALRDLVWLDWTREGGHEGVSKRIVESSDLDPEAPSKAYYVADGVIYAENANLGSEKSRRDYAVDYLGSVTGLTAGSDASLSSVRRWSAYGKLLSGFAEPIGYFWTGNTGSRVYQSLGLNDNRARHYGRNIKQWITRDPLWPSELPYAYVSGNPVTRIDFTGKGPQLGPHGSWETSAQDYINNLIGQLKTGGSINLSPFYDCIKGCTPATSSNGTTRAPRDGAEAATWIADLLDGKAGVYNSGKPIRIELHTDCPKGCCGKAVFHQSWIMGQEYTGWYIIICVDRSTSSGQVVWKPRKGCGPAHCILLHELLHAIALKHSGDPDNLKDDHFFECVSKVAGCESYTASAANSGGSKCKWSD